MFQVVNSKFEFFLTKILFISVQVTFIMNDSSHARKCFKVQKSKLIQKVMIVMHQVAYDDHNMVVTNEIYLFIFLRLEAITNQC